MPPLFSQSRRILKLCGLILALIPIQFGMVGVAHATPGCITGALANSNADDCQWHFANPNATLGGGNSGTVFGDAAYGGEVAPSPIQSKGIRQDKGVTGILYNNYANDCRFVDNIGGNDLFVPQKTAKEFESFVDSALTSSPQIAVFGYCTQGYQLPYTPVSTKPNGFQLFGSGESVVESDPKPIIYATSPVHLTISVPTTRVPTGFFYPTAPMPPIVINYFRQDCRLNATQTVICNQRPIVETQTFQWVNTANPDPRCVGTVIGTIGYGMAPVGSTLNCDGNWLPPVKTSTYQVGNDPQQWSDPYEDFSPPGLEGCNRSEFGNGTSWTQVTISQPFTQACPFGTVGTESCTTSTPTFETCNDGLVMKGPPGPATLSCDPSTCIGIPIPNQKKPCDPNNPDPNNPECPPQH